MLIEFKLANYRSIRDEQTLSMLASPTVNEHEDTHVLRGPEEESVLCTALVYGANASGKSNVLDALDTLRLLVKNAAQRFDESDELEYIQPFRLNPETREQPSQFEATFVEEGIYYIYSLSVSRHRVVRETLVYYPEGRPRTLFVRTGDRIDLKPDLKTPTARSLAALAARRSNVPFLSILGQFEEPKTRDAYHWFSYRLRTTVSPRLADTYTKKLLADDPVACRFILDLLRRADIGIQELFVERRRLDIPDPLLKAFAEIGGTESPPETEMIRATFQHGGDPSILLDESEESMGTLQLLTLAGPLYDVIRNGLVLILDELDASLHPDLARALVSLFNTPDFNRQGAQLVANTHDVTQLDLRTLRRDNVWFTEKGKDGSTTLYPLTDFSVRNDVALQKNYLQGRFGALPALGFSMLDLPVEANATAS